MQQYHKPQTKKVRSGTGGARGKFSDKRRAHVGGVFTATKIAAQDRRQQVRMRGGRQKVRLKTSASVNLVKDGKIVRAKLLRVVGSHNPEFIRQNIVTRGAVVETDMGKARVTNRVGQDGVVNAVLVA